MTIRLRAKPFNITVAQVYAPTSDYDDKYIDNLKQKMQEVVEKVDIKDISIIQGSLNAKDSRRNSFQPLCSLRTTVATVSSRRLTGSEAAKLGLVVSRSTVFCRLASLLSGMVSTTSQRNGKTTSSHCVLQLCSDRP
ncbi:hypothetical protein ACOMHN_036820 [Nucella lapillus]